MLKLLETANIKLATVVTDVFGVSGRRKLRALLDGQQTPAQMAELAKGRMRKKLVELTAALEGRVDDDHRFLLEMQLERLEQLEMTIERLDRCIDAKLEPYREQHTRLMQIPGVDRVGAAVLIAELGVDMSVFPSARHCAAWAGVSPGNNESAGKRRSHPTRKGNVHLTTARDWLPTDAAERLAHPGQKRQREGLTKAEVQEAATLSRQYERVMLVRAHAAALPQAARA